MKEDLIRRCLRCSKDIKNISKVDCCVVDAETKHILRDPEDRYESICDTCGFIKCRARSTHAYGCNESYRWGGYYFYYCPLGLSFIAGYISDEYGELVGGLVAGPTLLEEEKEETLDRLQDYSVRFDAESLVVQSTQEMNSLGHIVSLVCRSLSENEAFTSLRYNSRKNRLKAMNYSDLPETVYPLKDEQMLHQMICQKDSNGAKELLDKLFDHVYSTSGGDLEIVKRRSIELMVVISRASMDAGADSQEVFGEGDYVSEIMRFRTVDQLYSWLTAVLRRFIDYTFEFQQAKHANVIFNVKKYIQKNYSEKISLESVAAQVFLSPGYLSSLFKEATGESLISYINRVRVEESKVLLLETKDNLVDISNACGFEDQSYFARVFKKFTGVSPSKYRFYKGRI
ncbi:MAG: helix-turn-helix transcriptional regulator [Oscillospiraceae bacterium]|nr:helix-turn-helix transcriptional regulator [Oscillospiraceae bacterium]